MIAPRRSEERGHIDHGWLNTYHTFSFSDYQDPEFMGFRNLRVINEDFVSPGEGFDTHGHHDMEIVTYILDGELSHKDSMGNGSKITAGEVQYMSAGSGVRHSEFNSSQMKTVHLLQIWILPNVKRAEPRYAQQKFNPEDSRGRLKLLISPNGEGDSIGIRQFGQPAFEKFQRDQLSTETVLHPITPEAVEQGPSRWKHEEDQARLKPGLSQVYKYVSSGNWKSLGLEFASTPWRKYLLTHWWREITDAIKLAGREPMLPVKDGEDALTIEVPADVKDFEDVIPFDPELWGEFVRRAMGSEERYTDLNATSIAWWGKPFPKGILRRPSETAEITVQTADGKEKVKAVLIEGPLAVNFELGRGLDHPEGARYSLTHVPSGLSVMRGFRNESVATAALRFTAKQRIDWSKEIPETRGLDSSFHSTMTWLKEQVSVPSDEEIRRYATQ